MARAYSLDLREKIISRYKEERKSVSELAKIFDVSASFIFTLLKKFEETGDFSPKGHGGGRRPSVKKKGEKFIIQLLNDKSDLTLEEIRDEYNQHFDSVGRSTIDRTLKRLKITRKKKPIRSQKKYT